MKSGWRRTLLALLTLLVWILIVLWGFWEPHETANLAVTVSGGIAVQVVAAGLFLVAVVLAFRWRDIGFGPPRPWRSLRVLWPPAIYLVLFATGALLVGLPPLPVIGILAANTIAVGFSEELMFRGVLFRGLRASLGVWPSILVTSVLFGAVHVFNVFTTGDLLAAVMQACAAFMSGVFFLAIYIRTRSIVVGMIFHALWDFLLTVFAAGAMHHFPDVAAANTPVEPSLLTTLVPILFILPNLLFGLYLLRKAEQIEAAKA